MFRKNDKLLKFYSDADYTGSAVERRSNQSIVLDYNLVQNQNIVARSSAES